MLFNKKLLLKNEKLEQELQDLRNIQHDLKTEMLYFSINSQGKIKEVNDHFLQSSGYQEEELINKNWERMKSLKNTVEEYTLVHKEDEIEKEDEEFNISETPIGNVILNEVIVLGYKKDIDKIKKLRNKYLHISHTYENSALAFEPLAPCFDYKRKDRKG